jgi:hypothetical protein
MQITSDILNKPSIKKHYGQKMVSGYPEALIEFEKTVFTKNIETLKKIWPYLSFDLALNNIDWLEILPIPINNNHNDWLVQNIKPQSFLNMINQHYTKVGCISINTFIKDTFDQLEKLIKQKVTVDPPKRWRLIDFHDHVSYLYLKNNTKNNKLQTIITPYKKDNYLLSQPKESIEIIIWGKKVKNCVASYEERIGESIWIFFIERDGVPLYTVETDMKNYHIKQIVSQCNGSVDTSSRDFAQALILEAVGKK